MAAELKDFYGTPNTDYDFLFEGNSKERADGLARMNATLLTAMDATGMGNVDTSNTYMREYNLLKGAAPSSQNSYVKSRAVESISSKLQADIRQILTASSSGLLAERAAEAGVPETDYTSSAIDRLALRAAEIQSGQSALYQASPEAARNLTIDGGALVLSALNAYRSTDQADKRARIHRDFNDMVMFDTMNKLGHSMDMFSVDTIDDWIKEFALVGKVNYEFWRYDVGPRDVRKYNAMSPEEQMAKYATTAQKLVDAKADPLTVFSVLGALDGETNPILQGAFGALDLAAVYAAAKVLPKAAQHGKRALILRKYTNAPGIAAQIGDMPLSGRLSAMALTGDDLVATATGIDRTTAGMNASPFNYTPLDSTVTHGAAADTLKFVEDERKLQNYYLNRAVNKDTALSSGFLRPEDRAAAQATIMSRLPNTAEIVTQTPFGIQVRVTTKNAEKFTTPEELAAAEKRYEVWSEAYQRASDELDRFYSETVAAKFEPDANWVNRLEAQKTRARQEMDQAYSTLTKGIEPDKIEEKFVWYTRNEFTGTFEGVLESSPLLPKLASPDTVFRKIDSKIVPERTEILAKQEQLHKLYKEMFFETMSNLNKKGVERVNAILLHGDDTARRFTISELSRGVDVPGVGTLKLDHKEIAGYYKARDIMDQMHGVRSVMKYRRLAFEDFRQTHILVDDGAETLRPRKVFVKNAVVTRTKADGSTSVQLPSGVARVFDARGTTPGKVVGITGKGVKEQLLEDVISNRAWVVKLEQPLRVGDDFLNYAIVETKRIRDLTPDVLPYKTGYVPRIYENVPYVVRSERMVRFDGVEKKAIFETERFFSTRKEAEVWAATKQADDGIKRIADSDHNWRTNDPQYARDINEAVFSGLYEDYRGQKIPFGPDGTEAPRVGAYDAMDRYLMNLSWSYPLNEWRQAVLQRYFNTVNKYLETPNDINSLVRVGGVPEDIKNAIYASREYLQEQLSITSEGERLWARTARSVAENMEKSWFWNSVKKVVPNGDKLTDKARLALLYGADNADAYGYLRAMAFHAYLGFANISQFFVQAANAAVVFSLHPLNAPAVMRRQLATRMVAFLNPADPRWEKTVRIAAKAALMRYEDFEPMVRALHRSGWAYTTRISADAAMAMRGLSPGGDLRHLGRAAKNLALAPFQEGELQGRLYSFIDTYTRMARKNPGVDLTQPDKINDLVREATRVAFNYTQANRAYWQKGALSIPTQFLQVPAKFYEAVFMPTFSKKVASQFTRYERAKLALGQVALFGSLGIPFGPYIKDAITKYFTEEGENGALYPEIDDQSVIAITGGLTDYMASLLFSAVSDSDTHIALSQRVALANGFDLLISNFTSSDPDLARALLGATGGVIMQRAFPALDHVVRVHGTQLASGTISAAEIPSILDKLATVTTSWNNIHRARLYTHLGGIASREGSEILPLDVEGEDAGLILAKKLGLGSYEEIAAYRMKDWNGKNNPEKELSDALKTASMLAVEYSKDGYKTYEGQQLYSKSLNAVRESLSDEELKIEFDSRWSKLLWDTDSLAAKEYKKMLHNMLKYDMSESSPPIELNIVDDIVTEEIQATGE